MYDTVLLTLDGSELAEQAIPHAALVAKTMHSRLVVLRILQPLQLQANPAGGEFVDAETYQTLIDSEAEEAKSYIDKQVNLLREQGINAEGIVQLGTAPTSILGVAEDENAKLIVLATRGRSGIVRAVLGSVADHIARHASAPVLLVRAKRDEVGADEKNAPAS
jgi:nucleotide-binding universal stress UspA family protein